MNLPVFKQKNAKDCGVLKKGKSRCIQRCPGIGHNKFTDEPGTEIKKVLDEHSDVLYFKFDTDSRSVKKGMNLKTERLGFTDGSVNGNFNRG